MSSPQRAGFHGIQENDLGTWAGVYRATRPNVHVANNSTVFIGIDNEFQPDLSLWCDGGSVLLREDGYLEGAPEMVIEIAASSVAIELFSKKNVYRRAGVADYFVWRVLDKVLDWFVLVEGEYVPFQPGADGVIERGVFPWPASACPQSACRRPRGRPRRRSVTT